MSKQEFLKRLKHELRKLKKEERNKYIAYYDEIIADIVDSGMSEAAAVEKQGSVEQIAKDILAAANPANLCVKDWRGITLVLASALMLLVCIIPAIAQVEINSAMSIIGGADGPTSVFLAGRFRTPWGIYIATAVMVSVTIVYFIRKKKRK